MFNMIVFLKELVTFSHSVGILLQNPRGQEPKGQYAQESPLNLKVNKTRS